MMKEIWDHIHAWLEENAPLVRASLRPPATMARIRATEKELGVRFPEDVRRCYLLHDGQNADSRGFPPAFLHGWEWLSLERMVDEWRVWKDLVDAGDLVDCVTEPDAGVREDWYHPGWVPITYSGCGDHHCLDLAPAPGGTVGQIIEVWHDMASRPVVAPSFIRWLEHFAAELEEGDYRVTAAGLEQD